LNPARSTLSIDHRSRCWQALGDCCRVPAIPNRRL